VAILATLLPVAMLVNLTVLSKMAAAISGVQHIQILNPWSTSWSK
jgi:hypothetical protein